MRRTSASVCKLAGTPSAEIDRRVAEVAKTLQLEPLLERKPRQLSGGQRQRVAIGRSIIRNPKVFLFDEPLSNLDAALRVQMRLEIARLHQRLDATMVYVTHDQTEAMTLADRIVVFNAGRIEQVGTPIELYENPANTFVAGFIGAPSMNFIEARIDAVATARRSPPSVPHQCRSMAPGIRLPTGRSRLAFVPSTSRSREGEADFTGTVEIVEKLGAESLVYCRPASRPDPRYHARFAATPVNPGDSLPLSSTGPVSTGSRQWRGVLMIPEKDFSSRVGGPATGDPASSRGRHEHTITQVHGNSD